MATCVIVGNQYNTNLGLIRALGEAGNAVYLVTSKTGLLTSCRPDLNSRYLRGVDYVSFTDEEEVVDAIKAIKSRANGDAVVAFAATDVASVVLDRHLSEMRGVICPNVKGIQGQLELFSSKSEQVRMAKQVGFKVPKSWVLRSSGAVEEIAEEVTYPCFCKAESRYSGSKSLMQKCEDGDELQECFSRASSAGVDVLVQEYLDAVREYAVPGASCCGEVCVPLVIEKTALSRGRHQGVTLQGKMITPDAFGEVTKKIERFVSEMGFNGVFDAELIETDRGMFFCEMNLRPGTTVYASASMGINLPELFVEKTLGLQVSFEDQKIEAECLFCNEKAVFEELDERLIGRKEAKALLEGSQVSLLRSDVDPRPYSVFKMGRNLTALKRGAISLKNQSNRF